MQNTTWLYTVLLLALVLTGSGCKPNDSRLSAEDIDEISEAVNQSFLGLVKAARSLDADAYFSYFDTERFTALSADGTVTHSFEKFAETVRQQFTALQSYQSLEFSQVKISVINADVVVLVNEYQAEVVLKSGDLVSASGGGTQVWALQGDEWKLVSVSSSAGVP